MYDTAGEVLKKLISNRLAEAICAAGGLSPGQFRSKAGRSKMDAVIKVVDLIHSAEDRSR